MIRLVLSLLTGSLGLDTALISVRTIGSIAAGLAGAVTILLALGVWIAMGIANRDDEISAHTKRQATSLEDTEARDFAGGCKRFSVSNSQPC